MTRQLQKSQIRLSSVDRFLKKVAMRNSGSKNTQKVYRRYLKRFFSFVGVEGDDIVRERKQLETLTELDKFKEKWEETVEDWILALDENYSKASIKSVVAPVSSFFKYEVRTELRLNIVPKVCIEYHNREITRKEIEKILAVSDVRDRAFFAFMIQSGLRPHELVRLKIKHLQPDLENGTIPLKVNVPKEIAKGKYHGFFSFVGAEAVKHLKEYFARDRRNLTKESYVFTNYGKEEQARAKIFSQRFHKYARKLKKTGVLDFETRDDKPAELRLYSLRKYFKNHSHEAGPEYVKFWMGHTLGVEEHYFTRDVETHRKQYAEKALPFLRLETKTPTETEKRINEQAERIKQLESLVEKMTPAWKAWEKWQELEKRSVAHLEEEAQRKGLSVLEYIDYRLDKMEKELVRKWKAKRKP